MQNTLGKYPSVNTEHKDVFPDAPSPTITSFLHVEISFRINGRSFRATVTVAEVRKLPSNCVLGQTRLTRRRQRHFAHCASSTILGRMKKGQALLLSWRRQEIPDQR